MGKTFTWRGDEIDDEFEPPVCETEDLGLKLTPPQWAIYNDETRFRIVVAGRRFGKTTLLIPELLRGAWGEGLLAWYLAPTYRQAKDVMWRPLKKWLAPYILGKPNESELSIELKCGGRIALRSADRPDSLRGPGLKFLAMDEYADMDPTAWEEVLRPMLADHLGRALFTGTPKGFNHFHALFTKARDGRAGYAAHQYTTLQGGNVPASEVEAARAESDEKTFRQEYEASFENIGSGRVYYAFDRNIHLGHCDFNPRLPLSWTLDFNINPMCSVIAQIDGERVFALEELFLPDTTTQDACDEFLKRARRFWERLRTRGQRLHVKVYGDTTGQNRMHVGVSDWQIVEKSLSAASDWIRPEHCRGSKNPAPRDRIAAVNARLRTADGRAHTVIGPGCVCLTRDLEQVMYKTDGSGNQMDGFNTSNPLLTHISDAFGYMIAEEFGINPVGGPRSRSIGV